MSQRTLLGRRGLLACSIVAAALAAILSTGERASAGSVEQAKTGAGSSVSKKQTEFCAGAQEIADLGTQLHADLKRGVKVSAPSYLRHQSNVTVTALAAMLNARPAPKKILPTLRGYTTAYSSLFKDLQTVGFQIPPADANGRKLIENSMHQYSPIALVDLPKIDDYVKTSCGFPLGLSAGA